MTPISIPKNKRKTHEPLKVIASDTADVPLKKRIKYEPRFYDNLQKTKIEMDDNSFGPRVPPSGAIDLPLLDLSTTQSATAMDPAKVLVRHPGVTTLHRSKYSVFSDDAHDLSSAHSVETKNTNSRPNSNSSNDNNSNINSRNSISHSETLLTIEKNGMQKVAAVAVAEDDQTTIQNIHEMKKDSTKGMNVSPPSGDTIELAPSTTTKMLASGNSANDDYEDPIAFAAECSEFATTMENNRPPQQRNYKNMTPKRRIEANARERTRVQTISAAYKTLRQAIPSYSNTQKLTKLSLLRVARAYIVTLSRIAGNEYSTDHDEPTIAERLDDATKTMQTEGKIRKKKDT